MYTDRTVQYSVLLLLLGVSAIAVDVQLSPSAIVTSPNATFTLDVLVNNTQNISSLSFLLDETSDLIDYAGLTVTGRVTNGSVVQTNQSSSTTLNFTFNEQLAPGTSSIGTLSYTATANGVLNVTPSSVAAHNSTEALATTSSGSSVNITNAAYHLLFTSANGSRGSQQSILVCASGLGLGGIDFTITIPGVTLLSVTATDNNSILAQNRINASTERIGLIGNFPADCSQTFDPVLNITYGLNSTGILSADVTNVTLSTTTGALVQNVQTNSSTITSAPVNEIRADDVVTLGGLTDVSFCIENDEAFDEYSFDLLFENATLVDTALEIGSVTTANITDGVRFSYTSLATYTNAACLPVLNATFNVTGNTTLTLFNFSASSLGADLPFYVYNGSIVTSPRYAACMNTIAEQGTVANVTFSIVTNVTNVTLSGQNINMSVPEYYANTTVIRNGTLTVTNGTYVTAFQTFSPFVTTQADTLSLQFTIPANASLGRHELTFNSVEFTDDALNTTPSTSNDACVLTIIPPACVDADGDGFGVGSGCVAIDCNDANIGIHPNATEVCNSIDDDCDTFTDEGLSCGGGGSGGGAGGSGGGAGGTTSSSTATSTSTTSAGGFANFPTFNIQSPQRSATAQRVAAPPVEKPAAETNTQPVPEAPRVTPVQTQSTGQWIALMAIAVLVIGGFSVYDGFRRTRGPILPPPVSPGTPRIRETPKKREEKLVAPHKPGQKPQSRDYFSDEYANRLRNKHQRRGGGT